MYKKKQVSVNRTGHDLHASFCNTRNNFHMEKTMIGVRYWEVIQKGLSHLGPIVLSANQGMSASWDVRYWEVSL